MGNGDQRNVGRLQIAHDLLFGAGVQRAGGLIQHQYARFPHQSAGDLQPLALPAGQIAPIFAQQCIVSIRPQQYLFVDAGQTASLFHILLRDGIIPQGDIVADGVGKQHYLLIYDGNMAGKTPMLQLADRNAVKQHLAFSGRIQSRKQACNRRFPRTCEAGEGYALTGKQRQVEMADKGRFQRRIAKADVAHLHTPCPCAIPRGAGNGIGFGVHHVLHALQRDLYLMHFASRLRQRTGRAAEAAVHPLKRQQHTRRHLPGDDQRRAAKEHQEGHGIRYDPIYAVQPQNAPAIQLRIVQ